MPCAMNKVREIKYFSPDGSTMPNGVNIQRGGFLKDCRINANSFKGNKFSCSVVVLPSGAEVRNRSPYVIVDGAFNGRYFDQDSGCRFDSESMSIPFFRDYSPKRLRQIGNEIAIQLGVKSVLVKDFRRNEIFLVDA